MNKRSGGGGFCGPMMLLFALLLAFGVVKSHPEWFKFGPARNPPGMNQRLEEIYQLPVPKHPLLLGQRSIMYGEAFTFYDAQDNPTAFYVEGIAPDANGLTYELLIRTGGVGVTIERGTGSTGYIIRGPNGQTLFTTEEHILMQGNKILEDRIVVTAAEGGFEPGISGD